jgi:hypothetical protein
MTPIREPGTGHGTHIATTYNGNPRKVAMNGHCIPFFKGKTGETEKILLRQPGIPFLIRSCPGEFIIVFSPELPVFDYLSPARFSRSI